MNQPRLYRPQPTANNIRIDTYDTRRCKNPYSGVGPVYATVTGYRAFVPAGHAGCGVAPSYRALTPYGENQKSSFKALPDNESIPTTPPPFRHTPNHSWPQPTTTVWRNLQQNLQHLRIHYSSFTIHHSSFIILHSSFFILHCLSPSPQKNATPKLAILTLAQGITTPT